MEYSYTSLIFSLLILKCIHGLVQLISYSMSKRRNLPPGPKGLPIIGNLLTVGGRPHESLKKLAKTYGPLMTIQLGFNTIVVASSTKMAREFLQKHDQTFLGRQIPHALTAQADSELSVVFLPGSSVKWRNLRKLCSSYIFTTRRLDALQDHRHQMMDGMVGRVVEVCKAGGSIHIATLAFGTSLNSLSNTVFSTDVMDPKSSGVHELKDLLGKILALAGKLNLADIFPFLKPFDPQRIKRDMKVSYDRLHELLDEMVLQRLRARESGSPRSDDFLDVLLDHCQEQGPEQFGVRDIKVLLADLFIGGTDTTTTVMEWTMTELLRHPNIMAKLKQELADTVGSGHTIKEKDIPHLPYLDAVLKESMRLHPIAPFIRHWAETDVEVCGYTIPKHTQVMVNAWAIAQDPAYWEKTTQFMPERFLSSPELDFRGTNFSFMPFSTGRRTCPGLTLAVRMMNLLLGSLLYHFDWKLPDGMAPEDIDMKDRFGFTLQKAIPLVAIPRHLVYEK